MIQQSSSTLNIVISALLIGFITSCGGGEDVISGDYLPVALGNSWSYIDPEDPSDSDSINITGTAKLSNGKTVFITTVSDGDKGYLSRTANSLILFHQTLNDLQGELIYSPPIKVGTTWQGREGEAKVVTQETVNTPAGIFSDCFRIDINVIDNHRYYSVWLAKNVGPVRMEVKTVSDGRIRATAVLEEFSVR
jgi:hypothetical protein